MDYYESEKFKEERRTWASKETNILIGDVSEKDKELFMGPVFDFDAFHKEECTRYFQLLGKHKFFKSNGEARRNGWDKEIPEGYSEHTIGKLKKKLYILKNTTGW